MPANASAAPNLMANPGFETSGSSATMFSDTLPDFTAWQTASGGFTLSAGLLTSTGAGPSTDLAVVRNSQDYQDGTGKTYPLARLGWRLNGSAAAYLLFSTTAPAVTTGAANTPSGTAVPIDFRLQVTYADPVSSQPFQTTLTYIATTP